MIDQNKVAWILKNADKLTTALPISSIPGFNLLSTQEAKGKMTTGNEAQRMKYLGVEILRKDATKTSTPETGLFRGLRERSDGEGSAVKTIKMILIGNKDRENDLKALNLAVFNVLSIRMLYGDTKELIVFKNNEADQGKAIELLEAALEEFKGENRMVSNDPEIVDIATFEDVPKEFFVAQENKASTVIAGSNSGLGGVYNTNNFQNDDWKKKEDERKKEKDRQEQMRWTPTIIKRIDELPTLKLLNVMKKKVIALATDEPISPLVDPDPDDTFVDEKKTSTAK